MDSVCREQNCLSDFYWSIRNHSTSSNTWCAECTFGILSAHRI